MANVNRPGGFRVVGTVDGSPVSMGVRERTVAGNYGTAVFPGDPITLASGNPEVADNTDRVVGVCVGVVVDRANPFSEHPGYIPANTGGKILVAEGPDYLFEVQEDSVGGAIAMSAIGNYFLTEAAAGSAVTGQSNHMLDSSSSSATVGQFQLVDLVNREDNAQGDLAKWLVRIAAHRFAPVAVS